MKYFAHTIDEHTRIFVVNDITECGSEVYEHDENDAIDESDLPDDFNEWKTYKKWATHDYTVDMRSPNGD